MHVNEHLYKIQNVNKWEYSNIANLHPQKQSKILTVFKLFLVTPTVFHCSDKHTPLVEPVLFLYVGPSLAT